MQNVNKLPSTALSETLEKSSPAKNRAMETAGEMRRFLAYVVKAAVQKEISVAEAAVAIKGCEQINASLYSEIKMAALQAVAGQVPAKLGSMRIADSE